MQPVTRTPSTRRYRFFGWTPPWRKRKRCGSPAARASRRGRWQTRGRRTACCAFAGFVLAQLLGGLLLDYWFPAVKFPSAASTFATLERRAQTPDVVAFGSSRFGAGFCPDVLREEWRRAGVPDLDVFNAAIEAGDVVTADYVLEGMLQRGKTPRLVILEISPETVAARNAWLGQHVQRQFTWGDLPTYLGDVCRSGNVMRLLNSRCLPLYLHRHEICAKTRDALIDPLLRPKEAKRGDGRKKHKDSVAENRGVDWDVFIAMNDDTPPEFNTQAGLPTVRRWLEDYRVGGTADAALERFVQRCRDEGACVVLVGVPVAQAHRALYAGPIERAFLARMTQLTQRYQACYFIDARGWIDDGLFHDNHHLTRAGGAEFSKRLARELDALTRQPCPPAASGPLPPPRTFAF